ncbi:MAG TPA: hypothetical protein VMW42_13630 [Desulfatiglandales bacterium]|nr:hypothetical protein [Desulfatiglandales bacterium]
MPISSRRYLFVCEHVVKYSGFADKCKDSYGLGKVNTKYLPYANSGGVYLGDIVFQKQA